MRQICKYLALAAIGCAVVVGCRDSERTMRALSVADSLIDIEPDSAYRLLQTLDGEAIYEPANEALYALLLTQARYKNYVQNENDSLINIAVDYFRVNGDLPRYARALFYQGTIYDDMGNSNWAMSAYKKAGDVIVKTTDTLFQGFINLNIGALYKRQLLMPQAIERLNIAYNNFRVLGDSVRAGSTLWIIGGCYMVDAKFEEAAKYCRLSIDYTDPKDTVGKVGRLASLLLSYTYDKDIENAKEVFYSHLQPYIDRYLDKNSMTSIAHFYCAIDRLDSAYYYCAKIDDNLARLTTQRKIAATTGDFSKAYALAMETRELTDSIGLTLEGSKLFEIEKRYDKQVVLRALDRAKFQNTLLWIIAVVVAFILTLLFLIILYRRKKIIIFNLELIRELRSREELYIDTQNTLLAKIKEPKEEEIEIRTILQNRMDVFKQLTDLANAPIIDTAGYSKKITEIINSNRVGKGVLVNLAVVVDKYYDGVISKLKADFPQLNGADIELCALICSGFSNQQLRVIYGFVHEKSISNKLVSIKNRMNISIPVRNYIEELVEQASK